MRVRFSLNDPQELIDPYLADVAASVARSKRIMVITGAGISCNSGIPVSRRKARHKATSRDGG